MWCVTISDPITFLISMAGIITAIIYIYTCSSYRDQGYDENLKKELSAWIDTKVERLTKYQKVNIILKDYETANKEIQRRDNLTLLVGSILIASSLFILANVNLSERLRSMSVYAFASIGLYFIWLWSMHYTSRKLGEITYDRIGAIENALSDKCKSHNYRFGIHSYIIEKTRKDTQATDGKGRIVWWLKWLRRTIWGLILILLSLAWMFLSLSVVNI